MGREMHGSWACTCRGAYVPHAHVDAFRPRLASLERAPHTVDEDVHHARACRRAHACALHTCVRACACAYVHAHVHSILVRHPLVRSSWSPPWAHTCTTHSACACACACACASACACACTCVHAHMHDASCWWSPPWAQAYAALTAYDSRKALITGHIRSLGTYDLCALGESLREACSHMHACMGTGTGTV